MTQQEIEAKLMAIQTYLQGQSEIITFHEQRIKELEVQVSILKNSSGGGQSTALLTGVESQAITYNLGEVYEVLFYNDIAYTARLQLKTVVENRINYLRIFKDSKQLPVNYIIPSNLTNFTIKASFNYLLIEYNGAMLSQLPIMQYTGNATFVKIQKK